jgi:hypothetical protein
MEHMVDPSINYIVRASLVHSLHTPFVESLQRPQICRDLRCRYRSKATLSPIHYILLLAAM